MLGYRDVSYKLGLGFLCGAVLGYGAVLETNTGVGTPTGLDWLIEGLLLFKRNLYAVFYKMETIIEIQVAGFPRFGIHRHRS